MIAPRTLRRWLWRMDAVLALLLVVLLAVALVRVGVTEREEARWMPVTIDLEQLAASTGEPDRDAIDWPAFREDLVRIHGQYPRAVAPSPPPAVPADGELALGAYKVVMFVRTPGRPDLVSLASKDPARPDQVRILVGEAVRGIEVESVECGEARIRVAVRRRRERFTYEFARWGGEDDRSPIRFVAACNARGPTRPGATGPSPAAASADGERLFDAIRLVPFYGEAGERIGLRVTGLERSGYWTKRGVAVGDVIVSQDERHRGDVAAFRAEIVTQGPPEKLLVRRNDGVATTLLALR